MNFIVSFFLAVTASLATLALQLCNDGLDANGGAVALCSVFAIALALYFVDYKKLFAVSRRICNVLLVVVVFSQLGVLFRSRQDFLAFSIANILALLQAVLFFQRKTTRIACQILIISLVEIAVGCVFQRSLYFVWSVPLYVLSAFLSLSLLFLNGERKYYATNVALKERFSKRKERRGNEKKVEDELRIASYETDLKFETELLKKASMSSASTGNYRFFVCSHPATYGITSEYFKRFALWSLGGSLCSALFFCLFPRFNQIGYGALQFEEVNWNVANVRRLSQTGFNSTVELGDLGPAIDSYEQVATVQFSLLDDAKRSEVVDPDSPIYFRGAALALYSDRQWTEVHETLRINDASSLVDALRARRKKIEDVLPAEILNEAKNRRPSPPSAPQGFNPLRPPFEPYPFPPANAYDSRKPYVADEFRAPALGYDPKPLSDFNSITLPNAKDDRLLLDELKRQIVPLRKAVQYDPKSDVVAVKMEADASDSPFVFHIRPFFVVSGTAPLKSSCASAVVPRSRPKRDFVGKLRYLFVTPAFHNGRQDALTPNQEDVWSFLPYYLDVNVGRFPRLRELAKRWDAESGYDENDFIGRAKYLESKLRDSGDFKYNRSGVLRDPSLDPLEDFVAERREGHCEYFSGALTLMLRAVDIPARIVVGYACNVDSKSNTAVVRQSDAHSWVEAYIPPKQLSYAASKPTLDLNVDPNAQWTTDGAWLRLDPTPAADREAERPGALTVSAHDLSSFIRSIGRDFILNFNGARQQTQIYAPIVGAFRTLANCASSLKNIAFPRCSSGRFKKLYVLLPLGLSLLSLITFVLWKRFKGLNVKFRWKRSTRVGKNKGRNAEIAVDKGTVALFLQIVKALERKQKTERRQGETPLEFVERCLETERAVSSSADAARVQIDVLLDFTRSYYLAAFGDVPISPQEKKRWKEFLRSLKQ